MHYGMNDHNICRRGVARHRISVPRAQTLFCISTFSAFQSLRAECACRIKRGRNARTFTQNNRSTLHEPLRPMCDLWLLLDVSVFRLVSCSFSVRRFENVHTDIVTLTEKRYMNKLRRAWEGTRGKFSKQPTALYSQNSEAWLRTAV